jgi:hypothetical protein
MKTITLVLLATASSSQISLAIEHFQIVAAIAHVESGGRFDAKGDFDKKSNTYLAHGAYQLHKDAWIMGGGSLDRWPAGAYNEVESTEVAMRYVTWIEHYLMARDVLPTPSNIYLSYCIGPSRFVHKYEANKQKCPITAKKAVARLESFLSLSLSE